MHVSYSPGMHIYTLIACSFAIFIQIRTYFIRVQTYKVIVVIYVSLLVFLSDLKLVRRS